MTVYKIIDGVLKGWQKKPNGYTLKENEIFGADDLKKPRFIDGEIVETWTQADQDAQDEATAQQTVSELLDKFEADGQQFLKTFRAYIRRQYDLDNLTTNQFKGIRNTLTPALQPLRYGDWDIAQDNVNAITPPTNAKLLSIYNKLKDRIDAYLLS